MNINLNWNTQQKPIPLFNLEITEEEGSFAKAKLVTHALANLPAPGTLGTIQSDTGEIFFNGALVGIPLRVEGHFSEIELIARPPDFPQKWEAIQKGCRVHPYWDELYIRPEKLQDFTERRDVQTTSVYCERKTGDVSLSDWFEGKQLH